MNKDLQEFMKNEQNLAYLKLDPKSTIIEKMKAHQSETHMANLLAYFFRPNEDHELGDLFLRAFFKTQVNSYNSNGNVLPNKGSFNTESISFENVRVETEAVTTNGKRVDLLVYNKNFVLCIEFKVNHLLNNDLADYEKLSFVNSGFKDNNLAKYFIILTPYNHEPKGKALDYFQTGDINFHRMILNHFIESVKEKLPEREENSNLDIFLQTIENRAILHRRKTFLEFLNQEFHDFILQHKHGYYLERKSGEETLKIRVKNGELKLEKWSGKNQETVKEWELQKEMNKFIIELKEILKNEVDE